MDRFVAVAERAAALSEDAWLSDESAYLRIRAFNAAGQFDNVRSNGVMALAAARAAGNIARAAEIARTIAVAENWAGDLADIKPATQLARDLSLEAGDDAGTLEMDALLLNFHWGAGSFSAFVAGSVPLIEHARAMGNDALAARIMHRAAGAARLAGQLQIATGYMEEAREISQRLGLRAQLREIRSSEATGLWLAGDPDGALAVADEVGAEAVGDGDANRLVFVGRRKAEILASEGRYAEAVAVGTEALAESIRTGERWNRSEIAGHLAVNLLRVGRTAEAEARYADAAATLRGPEDRAGSAEAAWAEAHVLAARGDHDAAETAFRASIAAIEGREFMPLAVSLRVDYADYLLERKRTADAAALLAEAERIAPPPPWNYIQSRRRALATGIEAQRV
jgi:tetratricopeptide (TPR) repeat protein